MPKLERHKCGGRQFAIYRRDPEDRQFKTIEDATWCENCGLLAKERTR